MNRFYVRPHAFFSQRWSQYDQKLSFFAFLMEIFTVFSLRVLIKQKMLKAYGENVS